MPGAYQRLRAWRQGVDLVPDVYRATQNFPKAELYGLTSQIRRAAVSIPSNVAEGKGRFTDREFAQYLRQARGSLLELEPQLLIAGELGYMSAEQTTRLSSQTEQLAKTINALLGVLKMGDVLEKRKKPRCSEARVGRYHQQATGHKLLATSH